MFRNNLKAYTRDNWGKRVTSEDFQKAMEKGLVKKPKQREVSKLFDAWVFGEAPVKAPGVRRRLDLEYH